MGSGFHHYHKRKRKRLDNPYSFPSRKKLKDFMDTIIYIVAIFGPFIAIPQVLKIWYLKDASGVSLLTWIGYLFGGFFWLSYGIIHKEKPIIITNSIWILVQISIITGILRFGLS